MRIRAYREFSDSLALINQSQILDYDEPSEVEFHRLQSPRLRVGSLDLKIASVALANSLVVVTRNRRDFGLVPGLVLEDWSDR